MEFTRNDVPQLIAVMLVGVGVAWLTQTRAPVEQDVSANQIAQSVLADTRSPTMEVPHATLTMVVFSDYQCPVCKVSESAMEAAVAEDQHIRVIYKDWPIFGVRSVRAAEVAIAFSRQGPYTLFHNRLMADRRRMDDSVLQAVVESVGGSWNRVQDDLRAHQEEIAQQLATNGRQAFGLGIPGTPAYLVGNILIIGGLTRDRFRRAFAASRARTNLLKPK